jgi:glucose/mannose transport system substrate-binding protein
LEKLGDQFHREHPDAVIVNGTLTAGGVSSSDATLRSRILAGDPPDGFHARLGEGFRSTWVATHQVEPLDEVYEQYGLEAVFPPRMLSIVSDEGHPYSVPVSVHRANVLWYNEAIFEANHIDSAALGTFDGWRAAAETLNAAGTIPLALGDSEPWAATHLFETVLIGTLGAEAYNGLWTGETDWNGPQVTEALAHFAMMVNYANADHSALTWDQANQLVIDGHAAMTIMGDWIEADYIAKGFAGYGWASPPGNQDIYDAASDGFGLPKNSTYPDLMREFLGVLGSKEGQETFSKFAGSICARTDCDYNDFDAYLRSSAEDWKTDAIVPSLAYGAAASEGWAANVTDAVGAFVERGDLAATQHSLALACEDAGVCQ